MKEEFVLLEMTVKRSSASEVRIQEVWTDLRGNYQRQNWALKLPIDVLGQLLHALSDGSLIFVPPPLTLKDALAQRAFETASIPPNPVTTSSAD